MLPMKFASSLRCLSALISSLQIQLNIVKALRKKDCMRGACRTASGHNSTLRRMMSKEESEGTTARVKAVWELGTRRNTRRIDKEDFSFA